MADVYAELDLVWKKLCRETGVIFNFLLGQNGDTLFAGACPKPPRVVRLTASRFRLTPRTDGRADGRTGGCLRTDRSIC